MTRDIRITLVFDPFGICAEAGEPVRNVQDEVVAFRRIEDLLRRDERFETVTPKTYIVDPECWEHFQSYRGVSGVAFHEVTPRTRLADRLGQKPPEWLTDQHVLDWQLLEWELAEDSVEDWPATLAERLVPGIREAHSLAAWLRLAAAAGTTPCVGNCEPLRQWFTQSFVQAAQADGVPSDVRDRLVANLEEVDNPKRFAAEWLRRRALLPLADFSAGNPLRVPGVEPGSPSQRVTARYLPLVFPLPESCHAEVCQKMRQAVRSARLQHADAFEEAVLRLEDFRCINQSPPVVLVTADHGFTYGPPPGHATAGGRKIPPAQRCVEIQGDPRDAELRDPSLTVLDAISVSVKLGKEVQYSASIDCLDETKALIDASIIERNQGLLQGSTWGAAKICYDGSPEGGGIRILDFKPMQTGRISLDVFRECRQAFTVEEWLDLIIRTLGYEPSMYAEMEKIWMLCRLIPLVQNRMNLMELAPPGSGKSYIYNNVSRHVWLTAGEITPAVLFYNRQRKTPGLLTRYDVLVLDEAQSLRFSNVAEMQAQLKGYLEQGVYARGECRATAECGLVLLANIDLQKQAVRQYKNGKPMFAPARRDYIRRLPEIFHESPTVDRFHGIIPGWEIPPFETQQQADGLGLKADYFAEVCHAMRTAPDLAHGVRAKLRLAGNKRDCTAVERLACGLAKLLLIEPDHPRFNELVVQPASELRRLVRTQLHALDPQGYAPDLQIERFESMIKKGTTLGRVGHYELLEEIGKGGMASVYKGLDTRTGTVVAIKRVRTEDADVDEKAIRREIDIYTRLQEIPNDHLLAVKDISRDPGSYALVTEFAEGGSLWDLMGGDVPDEDRVALDEPTVKAISQEILDGMAALHENDIVHRDIKPQNILRCDDVWKIADFGISKLMNKPVTGYTFQGAHTAPWAPPEQIQGAAAHPSADIYAWGRVAAFLLTGQTAIDSTSTIPESWKELLVSCIDVVPENRPAVTCVLEQLAGIAC